MAPRTLGVQRGCEHGVHFWSPKWHPILWGVCPGMYEEASLPYLAPEMGLWGVCPGLRGICLSEVPIYGVFIQAVRTVRPILHVTIHSLQ